MEKTRLLGKTPSELKEIALAAGLPGFTGQQIAQWIYGKRVRTIAEMTNLSKAGRERLSEAYEVGVALPVEKMVSVDGTCKYLFPVEGRFRVKPGMTKVKPGMTEVKPGLTKDSTVTEAVEAVMIPDGERKTLCVSSQAGCKMGCRFCMTGRQGFHGSLSAADILSQFFGIDEAAELTNAVFMGMGEPLDNWEEVKRAIEVLTADWGFAWSPKRITLSTIGVLPNLKRFLDECKCHLAVSLHDPFPEERFALMPVEKAYPIQEVIDLLRQYDFTGQRRVSFEYTMFAGHNDTPRHADALLRLVHGLECRVNLIRFHRIPDFPYGTSPQAAMEAFRDRLARGGVTATIRASRGEDIFAACGLLAGQHNHA